MNRFQASIIFLFFSLFAASNGTLIFTFQHEAEVRPPCIDDMKVVYLVNRTQQEFHKRFEAVHVIGATQIAECTEPKVRFISSEAVPTEIERKFFEDLGANPVVVAIVLKHRLRSYSNMHPADHALSQHRWAIEVTVGDFGQIYDIERLREPEWILSPEPLPSETTASTSPQVTSTSPSSPTTTNKISSTSFSSGATTSEQSTDTSSTTTLYSESYDNKPVAAALNNKKNDDCRYYLYLWILFPLCGIDVGLGIALLGLVILKFVGAKKLKAARAKKRPHGSRNKSSKPQTMLKEKKFTVPWKKKNKNENSVKTKTEDAGDKSNPTVEAKSKSTATVEPSNEYYTVIETFAKN